MYEFHSRQRSRSKLLCHFSSLILAIGTAGLYPSGRRNSVGGVFAFMTLQEKQRQRGAGDVCVPHLADWIHWQHFFILYYVKFRDESRGFHSIEAQTMREVLGSLTGGGD